MNRTNASRLPSGGTRDCCTFDRSPRVRYDRLFPAVSITSRTAFGGLNDSFDTTITPSGGAAFGTGAADDGFAPHGPTPPADSSRNSTATPVSFSLLSRVIAEAPSARETTTELRVAPVAAATAAEARSGD